MPIQSPKTIVLVADHGSARFFRANGHGRGLDLAAEMRFDHPRGQDIMADRPGRAFDSKGDHRHAMEPSTDPARVVEEKSARQVAERLGEMQRTGMADRIFLVMPPRMMGDVRRFLDGATRKAVAGEMTKDFTKATGDELVAHLKETIPC